MSSILVILAWLVGIGAGFYLTYKFIGRFLKRMHRLITDSYFGPFILTFFICLFILLMQFLWKYVDDLMGKDLEWYLIVELMFYASANLVPMALPLSILLSSIMTFGNLGEKSELVAMKSSGMSLFKIMSPLIVVIVMTSTAAFFFSNNLWPVANLKFRTLLWDITQKKPTFNLQPNVFYNGIEGYSIRIKGKENGGRLIKDVLIYEHTDSHSPNKAVVRADSGTMEKSEDEQFLILTLYSGVSYEETEALHGGGNKSTYFPHVTRHFNEQRIKFDLSAFNMEHTNEDLFKGNFEMLNLSQLEEQEDTLNLEKDERWGEYYRYLDNSLLLRRDSFTVINWDSIQASKDWWGAVTLGERKTITKLATNMVRNTKNYVERTDDEIASRIKFIDKHKIEWHRKFTLSFACVILFFIGAPLGAISRKGGLGLPVVFSVALFLVFHIVSLTGEKMAKSAVVEPWFGMWLSSMVLFPLGVYLTYKAAKDQKVFSGKFWKLFTYLNPVLLIRYFRRGKE